MEDKNKYGDLLSPDIRLHRQWFREMVKLLGIKVLYRAPKPDKHFTTYGEIESNYEEPILVGCIFDQHPDQNTMKKIGWVSELQDNSSIIHVDYDLPGLQYGALFIVPSGLDDGNSRIFRVKRMTNSIVYPASIVCEIVPEYDNALDSQSTYDYTSSSFNLLDREGEEEVNYLEESFNGNIL